jgi:Secretion system C-terminal sorting domain
MFFGQQIPTTNHLSPKGYFETVFDIYGKSYQLADINFQQSKTLRNGITSTTFTTADAGYFRLYFETGSGMEGNTTNQIERKAVAIQVFKDISNFINSPLTSNGLNNKVNIWVRDLNQLLDATTSNPNPAATSSVLGLATSFYTMPNGNNPTFGGIVDNEIWKTIHTGVDSYTNVRSPLSTTAIASGASGVYYHGMMSINFNNPAISWNTNLSATNTPFYDLYSVLLHEITHALGFASLLSNNGSSKLGTGFNYYSRYDKFLTNNANVNLITQVAGLPSMYNYQFNTILNSTILQPNTPANNSGCTQSTACASAIKYNGSSLVPVHTPNCFSNGSSLSHFEDECIGAPNANINNSYFVMTDATPPGLIKHNLKIEEKNALCDMGYNVNANYTYGFGTAFQNIVNLGVACNGITVAGINDGLNPITGVYTISGITDVGSTINNVPINMVSILSNDTNATSFEGLEDVFVPTTTSFLSSTVGTASTTVNFHSSESGLHLLRYVPINSLGQRGNITYIFVNLYGYGAGCPVDNTCNLVNNGDFEQNTSLPNDISQINKACGWQQAASGTTDYFVQGATSANIYYPLLGVPCNTFGFENDLFVNSVPSKKAFAGMSTYQVPNTGGYVGSEPIYTYLKSPLAVNTSYQLSFDVSRSEYSNASIKFQAYLGTQTDLPTTFQDITITNPSLLFTNSTFSNTFNGWDHIVLDIPPQFINNLQRLAIGGINGVVFQNQSTTNLNPPNCPLNLETPTTYPNVTYYFIDNVKLVPLYGATFNLTSPVCYSFNVSDLRNYLASCPTNGVFAGNGVTFNSTNGLYSFQFPAGATSTTVTYTYTNSGCSITLQKIVALASGITPTFSTVPVLCQGSTPPVLPTMSTNANGITGTWSPTTISTTASGNYTFTPNTGQCAVAVSKAIQVLANTAFVANDDVFTVAYATSAIATISVLFNDTYNGGPIPTTIVGVPYTLLLTGTPPTIPTGGITFSAATGKFTIAPNTTPGTYVYKYFIQNSCYNTVIKTVKIIINNISSPSKIGFGFCFNNSSASNSTSSTINTNLYDSSIINGQPANATNATITLVAPTTTMPAGVTQNANGTITIAAGVLPGEIVFYYKVCSTTSCSGTITCTITIVPTLRGYNDTITATSSGAVNYNVLSNDTYRGTCSSSGVVPAKSGSGGNVVLTQIAPFSSYYSINSSGAINTNGIPPSGTYTLSYKICDAVFATICQNVSVLITVPSLQIAINENKTILDLNKVTIFPNPSDGKFSIYFKDTINEANIEIYNMVGQKIDSINVNNSNQYDYENSKLASGTYLIKVSHNEAYISKRIIIK